MMMTVDADLVLAHPDYAVHRLLHLKSRRCLRRHRRPMRGSQRTVLNRCQRSSSSSRQRRGIRVRRATTRRARHSSIISRSRTTTGMRTGMMMTTTIPAPPPTLRLFRCVVCARSDRRRLGFAANV